MIVHYFNILRAARPSSKTMIVPARRDIVTHGDKRNKTKDEAFSGNQKQFDKQTPGM